MSRLTRATRWLVVTTVGFLLLGVGAIMLVTPGPGLLMIVAGLAVLSIEHRWADELRGRARRRLDEARAARRPRRSGTPLAPEAALDAAATEASDAA
ncbi:MAG: PGPGW domain-containing protein [Actinomycetes bacterium]